MRNFSGKAPTFVVWVISLVLFVVALLAQFGVVLLGAPIATWSWIIGFGLLLLACRVKGLEPAFGRMRRGTGTPARGHQYVLYGKNLPDNTTFTRSPLGSGVRTMSMLKSIALMMPSPNSSWISSLMVVPYTLTISYQR